MPRTTKKQTKNRVDTSVNYGLPEAEDAEVLGQPLTLSAGESKQPVGELLDANRKGVKLSKAVGKDGVVKFHVYERFTLPDTTRPVTRLLLAAGTRVSPEYLQSLEVGAL